MRSIRRSGITALTAAIALGIAAVPLGGFALGDVGEGQAHTVVTPAAADVPDLVLRTTSAEGQVSWEGLSQTFNGGQFCGVTNVEGASLLTLTGQVGLSKESTELAGFREGQIGVFEETNASQCFRVDAGSFTTAEVLGLKLGNDLEDRAGPLLAKSASLDLEMRANDVLIEATTYQTRLVEGVPTRVELATFEFRTGKQQVKNPPSNVTNSPTRSGGHALWQIPGGPTSYFDEVELKAVVGGFSLEGGIHSGTPTSFDLTSQADAYFCTGGSDEYEELNASVRFLGNADASECSGFDISLEVAGDSIGFYKPLDVDPTAQFIFDVDWTLPNAGPAVQVNTPTIDFEIPGDTRPEELRKVPMEFCPAVLYEYGELVGVTSEADLAALTDLVPTMTVNGVVVPGTSGIQYACVRDPRDATITGSRLLITDQVFLIGDAKMILK
jgi:hypothetical protein